jgi:NTE family protein
MNLNKWRGAAVAWLMMLLPMQAGAQLATASVDPVGDSIAFAKMQRKLDRIRRTEHRPTVALVLSGGGAKGAAHVGVLRYLKEQQIPVDVVLGTSMGGLVGGLYALGYDVDYLDSLVTHMDWGLALSDDVPQDFISYATKMYKEKYALAIPFHYSEDVFRAMVGQEEMDKAKARKGKKRNLERSGMRQEGEVKVPINNVARSLPAGYITGLNVNNIFSSLSAGYQDSVSFLDFPIPFCCVASDMVSCKAKNWTSGSITEALRSTMSIPGLFDPVRTHGMVLVDGGTRNNFPTDIAREMGADYVIGVDLSDKDMSYDEINNIPDVNLRDYIEHKALDLMQDYDVSDIDEIGCFVVLDADEGDQFVLVRLVAVSQLPGNRAEDAVLVGCIAEDGTFVLRQLTA